MSQKLPVNGFEWMEKLCKFYEGFIKKYMIKTVIRGILLKQMLNIPKIYLIILVIYHFYLNERKLKNARNLFVTYTTKKTMLYTKEP